MRNFITRFAKDESGATAIEYGLIAVVIIGAVAALGTQLKTTFKTVKDDMASPPTEG